MHRNCNIFCDITLWDNFVGNLLYPAILGSLIYEFTNFKSGEFDKNIFVFITTVFYIIDYFYMHYVYKQYVDKYKKTRTIKMIFLDFLVAFIFSLIIFLINRIFSKTELCNSIFLFSTINILTIIVFIIALCYSNGSRLSKYIFWELIINSVIFFIFRLLILYYCNSNNCCHCLFEASIYIIFVIQYLGAVIKDSYLDHAKY